ncbi:hypothetical protein HanRHA438_Chr01g0007941 [Helianthus annuus]|nr:hypothetical protein HanRHA438_Chr01g0007941 [Helianthus annuus]
MLADSKLPIFFWSEAVSAACYTLNRVLTVKKYKKTCFELLHRYKPNLEFLEPFGSPCTFIDENGKFGAKSNEGFFVGYASPLKRVFVPCLGKVIQVQHVDCQKHTPSPQLPGQRFLFDYDKLWELFHLPVEPSDVELALMYQYEQHTPQEQVFNPPVVAQPTVGTHDNEAGPSGTLTNHQRNQFHLLTNLTTQKRNPLRLLTRIQRKLRIKPLILTYRAWNRK